MENKNVGEFSLKKLREDRFAGSSQFTLDVELWEYISPIFIQREMKYQETRDKILEPIKDLNSTQAILILRGIIDELRFPQQNVETLLIGQKALPSTTRRFTRFGEKSKISYD